MFPFRTRPMFHLAVIIIPLTFLATPLAATTWQVPSQCPTIQAGIDSAAAGDTVQVACGTYFEHDIVMKSGIVLRGISGDAACAVIDAEFLGRVIYCERVDAATRIEDITLTHGTDEFGIAGGGGLKALRSSLTIRGCRFQANRAVSGGALHSEQDTSSVYDCEFAENTAENWGGAVRCDLSGLLLQNCHFSSNIAEIAAGALSIWQSSPVVRACLMVGNSATNRAAAINGAEDGVITLDACTIYGNTSPLGPAIICRWDTVFEITNCVIAGNSQGEAIGCTENGVANVVCSDIFGNLGGDWVGCIADQAGSNGNFSADPLFCDVGAQNFALAANSPCLPSNHPAGWNCGLIGALGQGCGPISRALESWAKIKSRYR